MATISSNSAAYAEDARPNVTVNRGTRPALSAAPDSRVPVRGCWWLRRSYCNRAARSRTPRRRIAPRCRWGATSRRGPGEQAQRLVTGFMTVGVVQDLEVVEIAVGRARTGSPRCEDRGRRSRGCVDSTTRSAGRFGLASPRSRTRGSSRCARTAARREVQRLDLPRRRMPSGPMAWVTPTVRPAMLTGQARCGTLAGRAAP